MRLGAWLASTKLTLLPRSGTASRTTDGEGLFLLGFLFHGAEKEYPRSIDKNGQYWTINIEQVMEERSAIPNVIDQPRFLNLRSKNSMHCRVKKKGAGIYPAPRVSREMRSSEKLKSERTYLLSAIGLAPKSRRLLTAVRAARAAGRAAAAAP